MVNVIGIVNVSQSTVSGIITTWKRFGTTATQPRSGRPRKITEWMLRRIVSSRLVRCTGTELVPGYWGIWNGTILRLDETGTFFFFLTSPCDVTTLYFEPRRASLSKLASEQRGAANGAGVWPERDRELWKRPCLAKGGNTSNLAKHFKDKSPDLLKEFREHR